MLGTIRTMPSQRATTTVNAMVLPSATALAQMDESSLRELTAALMESLTLSAQQSQRDQETLRQRAEQSQRDQVALRHSAAKIDALTQELRLLRHWRFAPKSEVMHIDQQALFDEALESDMAALEQQIDDLNAQPALPRARPRLARTPLGDTLPRVDVLHEPPGFDGTSCPCGCGQAMVRLGEDVSEKLDYVPGSLRVQRHVRGRWACRACERVSQEPMPAHVIDKGLPTEALLAHVVVAKHDDHLPMYRQSEMFARLGAQISRSTLSQWAGAVGQALSPLVAALKQEVLSCSVLHADESPIKVLAPKGDTLRGYIWAFSPSLGQDTQAVIYEINEGRSGEHARRFLERSGSNRGTPWQGHLMVDDYAGYKALFQHGPPGAPPPVVELGCWAHARRKFHELHVANQSPMAKEALHRIATLYAVEADIRERDLNAEQAQTERAQRSVPELASLKAWMLGQRQAMTPNTSSAKALDYTLRRWDALERYAHSGHLPIDNNPIERLIRPWALGRKNWLFAGSLKAGQRSAAIMSLIESAKLNGLEPQAYLTDVLQRLPTQLDKDIHELLPTHWKPRPN
jgi:transposase